MKWLSLDAMMHSSSQSANASTKAVACLQQCLDIERTACVTLATNLLPRLQLLAATAVQVLCRQQCSIKSPQ
jgi:hypothetical protein